MKKFNFEKYKNKIRFLDDEQLNLEYNRLLRRIYYSPISRKKIGLLNAELDRRFYEETGIKLKWI